MPESLFGDILWGDNQWGDQDGAAVDPFTDLGGNPLILPAQTQAIFGDLAGEVETTRIYDMHKKGVREIDFAGTLMWKRMCAGPERMWAQIEARQEQLTTLYNVDEIDGEYLYLLKLTALWTNDTESVTDNLTQDELRQLIAQSPDLWDRRGAAGTYVEILNAIIGVDAFEIGWFDRRWILDETELGALDFRFGIAVLDAAERRFTEIHLADPARSVDRNIVAESLKLWRPINERVRVVFVELFDRFDDDTNPKSWMVFAGGAPTEAVITPGSVAIPAGSLVYTAADYIESKSDYMIRATITPSSTAGYFGVGVRHQPAETAETIELRVNMDTLTFEVWQNGGQLPGTITVDLAAKGFTFAAGFAREMRVEVQGLRFAIWIDNEPIYRFETALAHPNGTAGGLASVAADMTFFEMIPLPSQIMTVGLGGEVTTNL